MWNWVKKLLGKSKEALAEKPLSNFEDTLYLDVLTEYKDADDQWDNRDEVELEFPKQEWEWHLLDVSDQDRLRQIHQILDEKISNSKRESPTFIEAEVRWFDEKEGILMIRKDDAHSSLIGDNPSREEAIRTRAYLKHLENPHNSPEANWHAAESDLDGDDWQSALDQLDADWVKSQKTAVQGDIEL